mgnify:CR=1 FL=1
MSDTLVLNRHFYAIRVISWRRALLLVYGGNAEVVDGEYRTYNFADWTHLSVAMKGGWWRRPVLLQKVRMLFSSA